MTKKIELLAPAGDFDSLRAAVENGADAVYLGGKLFNARQFAGNFDRQKLTEALNYAHVRGANIYLTMNTLVSDNELPEAVEFAHEAYLAGIDGIIVQDMGFAGILSRHIPGLPLHASTQMTVHNMEGVKALERLGFKRVVLARELSLEEIRHIAGETSMEIEIFIHGALCICYSGQCLMSSIIGGRSGNRGKCAQPCRLPYKLTESQAGSADRKEGAQGYLLSPKDLCTLPQIAEIAASGVKSLKIEGRMKSPEYVATVVRIYRKYLDMISGKNHRLDQACQDNNDALSLNSTDMNELAQVFNRGGFTGGYLAGKPGKDMMCWEKPKNWGTLLGEVLSYDRTGGIVKVKLTVNLSIGDGIEVWNDEIENPGTIVTLIRINGKNTKEAVKSDVVEIGNIKGSIFKGCKVYKTSDRKLLETARESFEGKPHKRVALKGEAILREGFPFEIKVADDDGNEVSAVGSMLPEAAINRPLGLERLADQLRKTGSTPFEFSDLKIQLDEGLSLPVSEINDVRRKALEGIEEKRTQKYSRAGSKVNFEAVFRVNMDERVGNIGCNSAGKILPQPLDVKQQNRPCASPSIALYFYEWKPGIDYAALGADRLYLPFKTWLKSETSDRLSEIRGKGVEVFLWTPVIIQGNYLKLIKEKIKVCRKMDIDGILAGNPSMAELLRQGYLESPEAASDGVSEATDRQGKSCRISIIGDQSFNVFNMHSVLMYKVMGFESLTLSAELNLGQICDISKRADINLETIVYGRLPLMTSEYCAVGCAKGGFATGSQCSESCGKGEFRLKDRLGIEFPLICDKIDCRSTILNSNVLFVPGALGKLAGAGVSTLRPYIADESPDRIKELVDLHRELTVMPESKKYAALINSIKSEGFTKGHFFKGV